MPGIVNHRIPVDDCVRSAQGDVSLDCITPEGVGRVGRDDASSSAVSLEILINFAIAGKTYAIRPRTRPAESE